MSYILKHNVMQSEPIIQRTRIQTGSVILFCLLLTACSSSRSLMPVPNIYKGADAPKLFNDLPAELRNSEADLLYLTDRTPEKDDKGNLEYGYGRSHSAAFGSAIVNFEPGMSWDDLQQISLEQKRSRKLTLELVSVEEQGRFPETPWPWLASRVEGPLEYEQSTINEVNRIKAQFQDEVRRRLAHSPKPEILLFVHGYNNHFEDAAQTLAELWHFMGREHIPILYTWPAGRGGPTGYIYDRESGEFTIYHLKMFLRQLSEMPEIEKIHLVGHSRGTDVLTTAVREIMLSSRAAGEDNRNEYRFENLVLAAPDLDTDVMTQRLIAEHTEKEVGAVTIYTSQGDKAIQWAARLFHSVARLGRAKIEEVSTERLEILQYLEGLSFIDLKEQEDRTGHGYFHSSPEASSDLIMTIRYGMRPGAEHGRPLISLGSIFWRIEPDYPNIDLAR